MDFPAPVIAKITGYCLGGGLETAMSCDFRFAAEDAKLGLPEVDLGIIPGAGGVQFISELANPAAAKEIAMTGDHISAARAEELGIVNRVPDDIDAETQEFAEKIASSRRWRSRRSRNPPPWPPRRGFAKAGSTTVACSSRCSKRKTTRKAPKRSPRTTTNPNSPADNVRARVAYRPRLRFLLVRTSSPWFRGRLNIPAWQVT